VLFTCAAVWSCEVLRGEVNHPRINGKDALTRMDEALLELTP